MLKYRKSKDMLIFSVKPYIYAVVLLPHHVTALVIPTYSRLFGGFMPVTYAFLE
jgi:hypothetical protein